MANEERLSIKDRLRTIPRWIFLTVVGSLLVIIMLWKIPEKQIEGYAREFSQEDISKLTPNERVQLRKSLIDAKNSARTTLAQIIGGLVLLGGLYFTWRNAKTAQETLRVTEEGKLTERFGKAVELLGSDKLDIRLGGIYALERIARDSLKDHWTVMEVLTAFIREKSQKDFWDFQKEQPNLDDKIAIAEQYKQAGETYVEDEFILSTDVQAALTVIGRRAWRQQEKEAKQRLNLYQAYLPNADLRKAHLEDADLRKAHLEDARFEDAYLNNTELNVAHLERADFTGAHLEGAVLKGAHLEGAELQNQYGLILNQLMDAAIIDEHTKLPPEFDLDTPQLLKSSKQILERLSKPAAPNVT